MLTPGTPDKLADAGEWRIQYGYRLRCCGRVAGGGIGDGDRDRVSTIARVGVKPVTLIEPPPLVYWAVALPFDAVVSPQLITAV